MKEEDILNFFSSVFKTKDKRIMIGPGDDCAILNLGKGKILLTADEMVEGTHFLYNFSKPETLASKLVRMNVSDIYSMGEAEPVACIVTAAIPKKINYDWIKRFALALKKEAEFFSMSVAGGNLSKSDRLHLTMTVIGVLRGKKTLRNTARCYDVIAGIGELGNSRAGLLTLLSGLKKGREEKYLIDYFWRPRIYKNESARIAKYASSMLDNSDGLFKSIGIIARANKLLAEIELSEDMISKEMLNWCKKRKKDWRKIALEGGEDYGLIFTLKESDFERLKKEVPGIYKIGVLKKGKGVAIKNFKGGLNCFEHF